MRPKSSLELHYATGRRKPISHKEIDSVLHVRLPLFALREYLSEWPIQLQQGEEFAYNLFAKRNLAMNLSRKPNLIKNFLPESGWGGPEAQGHGIDQNSRQAQAATPLPEREHENSPGQPPWE